MAAQRTRLTDAFLARGFNGVGVDCWRNKHTPEGPVVDLDLSAPEGQQQTRELLASTGPLALLWMSAPTGTSARSRCAAIGQLRAEADPFGVVGIGHDDQTRAARENELFRFFASVAQWCQERQVWWAWDGPHRAPFWWIEFVVDLCGAAGDQDVTFQARMHRGGWDKTQRIRTNCAALAAPSVERDKSHVHLPWAVGARQFAVEESMCPFRLCSKVADAVAAAWAARPAAALAPPVPGGARLAAAAVAAARFPLAQRAAAVGKQRRGVTLLAPEFTSEYVVSFTSEELVRFPEGHNFETNAVVGGVQGRAACATATVGIPWCPGEFVEEAVRLRRPFDALADVPDYASEARAAELDGREAELKAQAHPRVRARLGEKRTILFEVMLREAQFPNPELLVGTPRVGAPMVGEVPAHPAFDLDEHPASKPLFDLPRSGAWARRALDGSITPSADPECDLAVWKKTIDEVRAGRAE
ncbi:unnamed protein product, partial [Prorocentrum cordatum]